VQGPRRTFKLSGLHPSCEYTFRLRVASRGPHAGAATALPPSASPSLSLCTPPAAPGAPGAVTLVARAFNALKVRCGADEPRLLGRFFCGTGRGSASAGQNQQHNCSPPPPALDSSASW
jgi:hypothetical protein